MEYEADKFISSQQYLTAETASEEHDRRFTKALIITVFFVIALLSAIAWVMVITAALDNGDDRPGTFDEDFYNGDTEQGKDSRSNDEVILEVVQVPRITSSPPTSPPRQGSSTRSPPTLAPVTFPTRRSPFPATSSPLHTTSTTTDGRRPLNRALFCTYGTSTSADTTFPRDGLCDYIFYDSMYKDGSNRLNQTAPFNADLEAVFNQAQSGRYMNTQFGLGFSFAYLPYFLRFYGHHTAAALDPLTRRGVSHFGVIDCPVYGMQPLAVNRVFKAIELLNIYLPRLRSVGKAAYSVMGVISFNRSWNNYFKVKFKVNNASRPNLFISHGYQMSEDWQRNPCVATPPTVLFKPPHPQHNIHDLHDAVGALAEVSAAVDALPLSLSVTMKGRLTELLSNNPRAFSQCSDKSRRLPATYVAVCNIQRFSENFEYDHDGYAMRTYDAETRIMFLYDNEQALCEKLCKVKADYTRLAFGLAVFDLEYEDANNTCSKLNRFSRFSRLEMVAQLLDFFSNQYTDRTQENACSQLWRPKIA